MRRNEHSQKAGTKEVLRLTHRNLQVFAYDLAFGRQEAAVRLRLDSTTVRGHSQSVRRYYGVVSNIQAAAKLGWLTIPAEYE